MDLLGQFFWSLYAICKQFPNATSTICGIVIGTICGAWFTRRLIISLFEKYLGNNIVVATKLENHEERIIIIERIQGHH